MTADEKALSLLGHIGNELKLLWCQMETWQTLFEVEQEKRRQLQQKTAPGFFAMVQVSLAESILLRISRLLDPANSERGKKENASFQHLHDALVNDGQHAAVVSSIKLLTDEWKQKDKQTKEELGPYARLKIARNKWLAHNDFTQRLELDRNQLWMPLTTEDFAVAQKLASRIWKLYRNANCALKVADVIEPNHDSLANRSVMVLKHLSRSLYLDQLLHGDEILSHIEGLQEAEELHVGQDSILPVFGAQDDSGELR